MATDPTNKTMKVWDLMLSCVPTPPSNGPMPSEVGAPESDEEDELDVYDQMDASKFNEDGSFIGQYGGRKKGYDVSGGAGPSDHQRTHALSTFV